MRLAIVFPTSNTNTSQMLPVNRTSFKLVLHTSVGAAWYFHVIVVIISHLILAGIGIYHYRAFRSTTRHSKCFLCNPVSIHQCPARAACFGIVVIAALAVLRTACYCVGPYLVSLRSPHPVLLATVELVEYVCHALHVLVFTLLTFSQFLILVRAKSLKVLTSPSSEHSKHYAFHRFINLVRLACLITLVLFFGAFTTLFVRNIEPLLHFVTGLSFGVLGFACLSLACLNRQRDGGELTISSFVFYSTSSSSSSNLHASPEREAIESRIYYECHSGLPRCMTKTSLNEYFVPNPFGDKQLPGNNAKQTSIHINDLEIIVEIQEPLFPMESVVEVKPAVEADLKRESISTISSLKVGTIDGEQGGYVADIDTNPGRELDSLDPIDKIQKNESLIGKSGSYDERIHIRQMIVAEEYLTIFHSGLKTSFTMIFFSLLLGSLNIYNGIGKYGFVKYESQRTIFGWGIWLTILTVFRLIQYILLLLMLLLFRKTLTKIEETLKKTEYILVKQAQNRRGFRSQRRQKKARLKEDVKPPSASQEIEVYKCRHVDDTLER